MEPGTHDPRPFGAGTQRGDATEAKEKAKELSRTARERALSAMDQQKEQVSGLLERVADSIQDDRIGGYASDYARRGAEFLRSHSADEVLDSVRRGFRSRPGVVLSAAFVAGLAFARLMKGAAQGGPSGGPDDGDRAGASRWGERAYGDGPYGRYGESGYAEGSWASREEGTP